uniref:Uncharacterized protein n=1 Tax=Strongyloides venezuelensis TaxID=75913 RepID=A0A0K0FR90_STRVS
MRFLSCLLVAIFLITLYFVPKGLCRNLNAQYLSGTNNVDGKYKHQAYQDTSNYNLNNNYKGSNYDAYDPYYAGQYNSNKNSYNQYDQNSYPPSNYYAKPQITRKSPEVINFERFLSLIKDELVYTFIAYLDERRYNKY